MNLVYFNDINTVYYKHHVFVYNVDVKGSGDSFTSAFSKFKENLIDEVQRLKEQLDEYNEVLTEISNDFSIVELIDSNDKVISKKPLKSYYEKVSTNRRLSKHVR